jgi:hypothetical protein
MSLRAAFLAALAGLMVTCGPPPGASVTTPSVTQSQTATSSPALSPSTAGTGSPCIAVSSPPPIASWHQYSDATYGFKISYPPGFQFEPLQGVAGTAIVMLYRAFDDCYAAVGPPGQVELGVYRRDADTLAAWVEKHSDVDCAGSNTTAFIFGVSNAHSVTVDGRAAIAFDDKSSGCGGPASSGQETAFLLSAQYVFMVGWWTAGPDYAPTMSQIMSEMLSMFST